MATNEMLRAAVLNVAGPTVQPEAHANTLEWMKLKVATSQDLRKAVSDLERFTGETGELNHFLKGGDRLMARINAKRDENLLDAEDADALRAALVCRIKRSVLNHLQADEETPWAVVKERLKKAYGSGRWTIEEDIFHMIRETKAPRQTNGQYAATLLVLFKQITEKTRETVEVAEANFRMTFLSFILKVQLAKEIRKKESFPLDKSFVECAQEVVDSCAREERMEMEVDEPSWSRVTYRRPRPAPAVWKRQEPEHPVKIRPRDKGPRYGGPKAGNRREDRRCHGCGKSGHLVARCPRTRCFECGTEGHIARQCPYMASSRRETSRPEPMEVNAQRLHRRADTRSRDESPKGSSEESGLSDSEVEREETGANRRDMRSPGARRSGRRGSWRGEEDI